MEDLQSTIVELILNGKFPAKTFNGKWCGREIEKQTILEICRFQIAPTNRKMNVFERANRLQLDYNLFFDKKIQAMLANLMILIE